MINFEIKFDYKEKDDDDEYRNQFLDFFLLDEFKDEIIKNKQQEIYKLLKNHNGLNKILTKIQQKYTYLNKENACFILYSFENFDLFSEFIKKALKKINISEEEWTLFENQIIFE